jgi:transcriptional regulator with XRE-family HTH domain
MRLGDVIKKERERKNLTIEQVASHLGVTVKECQEMECGHTSIEEWGPRLAQIAIKLQTPTSRLISRNGKSNGAKQEDGQCGKLIKARREGKVLGRREFAALINLSPEEVSRIEDGTSPLETCGPLLLRFAELIEQPIFNLFYPCGIPLDQLDDY